ncbi:MAG: exonuclease SbcCD subunit D [Eubacteriales bacterium]
MIKILHTGDVHLDSAFSGLDSRHAEIRRNELRAAFTSMMTYARTNGVDLVLIAGDLFDGDFITRETVALLSREFERFEKPVFITPGNHDCAGAGSVWTRSLFPENVHVFTESRLSFVDLPDLPVTVYGFAFTEPSLTTVPIAGHTVDDPSRVNLLVCHCDMPGAKSGGTSKDCPVTAEHLDAFGADYAALGHIHNPPAPGHDGRWCYCGCLEARAFDETGPKGACIVEIEKAGTASSVTVKRVRFSKRRYEKAELALTGMESQADVREAVASYIAEHRFGEDTLLSLRLTGVVAQSLVIDTETLEDDGFGLFLLRVEDATLPDVDCAALEQDITITGELYRILKPSLESEDAHTREVGIRAFRYALSALAGEKTF